MLRVIIGRLALKYNHPGDDADDYPRFHFLKRFLQYFNNAA